MLTILFMKSPCGLRIARVPQDYGLRRGLLIARGLPRRDGFRDYGLPISLPGFASAQASTCVSVSRCARTALLLSHCTVLPFLCVWIRILLHPRIRILIIILIMFSSTYTCACAHTSTFFCKSRKWYKSVNKEENAE